MAFVPSNVAQFTFAVSGLEQDLRVVTFTGDEKLSRLFSFSLDLASENPDIDFGAVIGQSACLTLYGDRDERYVHGLISRFEQTGERGPFTLYQAQIVPQLWLLGFRHRCRIFQHMSVVEIISTILDEAGILSDRYRFVLEKTYSPRTYCVQYRESEFNFISRLMEEEGIYYWFEHTQDSHVLVMADGISAPKDITAPSTVIFHPTTGTAPDEEYVLDYAYAEEIRPGQVELRDFDFAKPSLKLKANDAADRDTGLEIYDYPGGYIEPNRGDNLAQVRLEAHQTPRRMGNGRSVCRRLLPGYRFALDRHPRSEFNQQYLLTSVSHAGAQPQVLEAWSTGEGTSYANEFACMPASVPFRPACTTRKPVVKGTQTAIVVGPAGEEIYTDEHGRVKVQFHWDREGQYDENSSCWIRVGQTWAGKRWGAMFIPRIGQEVIIDFLEGDPDKPIIVGSVYNGEQMHAYLGNGLDSKHKHNPRLSGVKSNVTKGGTGFNEFRFDDTQGKEQLFIHAERNMDVRVKSSSMEWIGDSRHLIVGSEAEGGKGDQNELVHGNKHLHVKHDQIEKIEGNMVLTIGKGSADGGNQDIVIAGDKKELIEADSHVHVKGERREKIDQDQSLEVGMNQQEKVGMKHAVDAGQEIHLKAGMKVIIEAGAQLTIKGAGGFIDIGPAGITIQGIMVRLNSGGAPGAGSGSTPTAPEDAKEAEPKEPTQADDAVTGLKSNP